MYAHHALVRTHPHRHSNTLARANKSTFLQYLRKWKTKEFNAMSLTQLAQQPIGYKSWAGFIQSLAGDDQGQTDQGQTFNTSLLVPGSAVIL